ncbi:hypothetical protein GA0115239_111226 [Streptomyces sp. BpilaLS-43]|nr:hypothetical protein GA0115239_111226 [Streptomyces sp. BpilaLS-43]
MRNTAHVEFFCYHRDRSGSLALRHELLEEHRSYMDRYTAEMIARGPTLAVPPGRDDPIAYGPLLSDDGSAWLGTAALVRAPAPDTARSVLPRTRSRT